VTRAKAIKAHCLDCAGGSAKDATLCHIVDCPLWEWRIGPPPTSQNYKLRMAKAAQRWPDDVREILLMAAENPVLDAQCAVFKLEGRKTTEFVPQPAQGDPSPTRTKKIAPKTSGFHAKEADK
jgi:hypothetical protein